MPATINDLVVAHGLLTQQAMVLHHRLPLVLTLAVVTLAHASGVARAAPPADAPPPRYQYQVPPPAGYLTPPSHQLRATAVPQSVLLSPKQILAPDDRGPPPAGYTPMLRKRKGLVIGGAVTFAVAFAYSTLAAAALASDTGHTSGAVWLPVVGSFALAGTGNSTIDAVMLAMGGAQLVGGIMLYAGMTTERRVFVRNDLVRSISVAPMVGKGASGMAMSGRF